MLSSGIPFPPLAVIALALKIQPLTIPSMAPASALSISTGNQPRQNVSPALKLTKISVKGNVAGTFLKRVSALLVKASPTLTFLFPTMPPTASATVYRTTSGMIKLNPAWVANQLHLALSVAQELVPTTTITL